MPHTVAFALETQESSAVEKAETIRRSLPEYLVSAALAGAFVGVAVVVLISVSAPMAVGGSTAVKLTQGAVFGIALTLVVFAGAELFTGVVMVMLQGLAKRTVTVRELLLVWVASWIGNLVGSVVFAGLVNASGVLSSGAPKGKTTAQLALLAGIIKTKTGLSSGQLFFRAVLCNFLVCLGLWMASRANSDAAKLICLWWSLLAFIASGFEHCVANMTVFALAIFNHLAGADVSAMGRNLLWTSLGNVVGGGLLVALAYSYIGSSSGRGPAPLSAPESARPLTLDDELIAATPSPRRSSSEPLTTALRTRATTAPPRRP
jgi:nitrite transporter NirC